MQHIAFLWPIGVGLFATLIGYLLNIGAVLQSDFTRLQSAGVFGITAAAECLFLRDLLPSVWRRAMAVAALPLSAIVTVAVLGPVPELRFVALLVYAACTVIARFFLLRYWRNEDDSEE